MPTTRPILDLIPGDLAVLPTAPHDPELAPGQDHELQLPLDLAARGALVLVPAAAPPAPSQPLTQAKAA